MPPALTPAEVLTEVLETPRRAFVPIPDLCVIERPGWLQIVTPSFAQGGFNEVAFSRLADAEADRVIDATIADYRARGIKFRWTVGVDGAPADLGARLERRGLVPTVLRGMARDTDLTVARGAEIEIREIDATTIDTFTQVMATGWSVEPAPLARAHEVVLAMPDRPQHLFVASWRGEPAAVASYMAFPRSAYLLGAVVLPGFRRRGLYGALVAARLAHARARGLGLATSHARLDTSAPLLAKLGFATVTQLTSYHG